VDQALGRLQVLASEAVGVLQAVMLDVAAPPAIRLGAARTVLEMALRGIEADEIEERLQALEAAAAQQSPRAIA
jgi:hypothetical protein